MKRFFDAELEALRTKLLQMGDRSIDQTRLAVRALSEGDQLRIEYTDGDVCVELLEGGGRLDESQTYAESSEELTKLAAQLPISATAPLDAAAQAA